MACATPEATAVAKNDEDIVFVPVHAQQGDKKQGINQEAGQSQ